MARRNMNQNILMVVGLVLVVLVLFSIYRKYQAEKDHRVSPTPHPERRVNPTPEPRHEGHGHESEAEYYSLNDYEPVGESDEMFQIGVGTGPGLYGSGRFTSSMVGN